MRLSYQSLLFGVAISLPVFALTANEATSADQVQIAQAAPADANAPLTEEEKKRRELELLKKRQKAGQKLDSQAQPAPNGAVNDKKPGAHGDTAVAPKTVVPLDKKSTAPNLPPNTAEPAVKAPAGPKYVPVLPGAPSSAAKPVTPATPTLPAAKILKPAIAPAPDLPSKLTIRPNVLPGTAKDLLKPAINAPAVLPALAPALKLEAIKKGRQEHVEDGGKRTVILEPGNRTIVKEGDRIAITHDDADRFRRLGNAQTQQRSDGVKETSVARPDGVRVITETDDKGHLLRVYRHGHDGHDESIIDNRKFFLAGAAGLGIGLAIALELEPPVVTIPRDRYIVNYRRASDDDLYEALDAPPLDRLERAYSLEEIRDNEALRERMRRIDLDNVNFRSGASDPSPDQYGKLERLARVLLRVLERHPNEVFLVEGYTDAVGSELDNLSLSDRRAESVAQILTETFGVPPENLITQGYGERFLKIDTQAAERANRRVAVRRITPLMAQR